MTMIPVDLLMTFFDFGYCKSFHFFIFTSVNNVIMFVSCLSCYDILSSRNYSVTPINFFSSILKVLSLNAEGHLMPFQIS